jgi:hypothetical protein
LASDLASLKGALALLEGEALQDGWAVQRRAGECLEEGLFLLTTWRVAFVGGDGTYCAAPIAKIHRLEVALPRRLALTTWYDGITLLFDNAEALLNVANHLRQDPNWLGIQTWTADADSLGEASAERHEAEAGLERGGSRALVRMS